MATYCGVDFHARQQTVAYLNTDDGEIKVIELNHQSDEVQTPKITCSAYIKK